MEFLAPLFLAGFAAVAVPILVHLTHRERREPVAFPSLMFVQRVPFRAQHRRRIRDWLLFLLRAAAVVLVCLAFARPLLRGAAGALPGRGAERDVVLLLDRSYSMEYGDRWSRALAAARETVAGLGAADRAAVILFSDRAEAANRPTDDRAILTALVDGARTEPATTRYAPAFRLARDLLAESDRPRRELVLVTDFQRSGWDGADDVQLPAGTHVSPVDISDRAPSNRAVADVRVERGRAEGPGRVAVSARIMNTGERAASRLRTALEVDGAELRSVTVDVPSGGAAVASFPPIPSQARPARARIVIEGDALPRDDIFHFVLAPPAQLPVVIVEHPAAAEGEALYLRRALELGDDPVFRLVARRGGLGERDLEERPAVLLHDASVPAGPAARRLREHVERGGGLLAVLGPRAAADALASLFPELLARGGAEPVDRLDGGATFAVLDYSHPVFAPFRTPGTGDFSGARFFRYRRAETAPAAHVLARFDDGAPALAEARVGSGRVMLLAAELSGEWNDLPLQPVFLPFLYRALRYLADYRETPAWYTISQVLEPAALPVAAAWAAPDEDPDIVVESPGGERVATTLRTARVELRETGFYTLRPLEPRRGEALAVAVNPDVSEGRLDRMDPEELVAAVAAPDDAGTRPLREAAALTAAELERRQGLWWYLLLAVLLLLAAESAVAGRTARAAR
ncbi:MAG: BatA domain-containing protein [Gemmatimonadetes bacterium]|nr:BatA domain-containing protein [Gemmatimonadota bacterium]